MRRDPAIHLFTIVGSIVATCGVCFAQEAGARAPKSTPASRTQSATTFESADQLLEALETADRGLESLTANVIYRRVFELQGDTQERHGRLGFLNSEEGGKSKRRFAIRFNALIVGDVLRDEEQVYVFDGEWLIEKNADQKKVARRQIAPPGRSFDPLRIGSGPVPIPIGQKRADILRRFDATLVPAGDGVADDPHALELASGAWQILLHPKPDQPDVDDDFAEVRLWYVRSKAGRLLPRMARTLNKAGDVTLVMLLNVETQDAGGKPNKAAEVPAEMLDVRVPAGWTEDVQPWREGTAQEPAREGADAGEP
jgi:hypothetical protein